MFAKISGKPVKRNDVQVNLSEVWRLVYNKQFKDALDILDASQQRTDKHLYARAKCLIGLRQYSDAVTCLVRMESLSISHKRSMAFCYRSMEKHDKALQVLYTIPRRSRDGEVLFDMARIYQEKADYQKAIDFYCSIEGWEQDTNILSRHADCQQQIDIENARNEIKPVWSWEYIRGNISPHTFFSYYNRDSHKGISDYAFERAAFVNRPTSASEKRECVDSDLYRDLRNQYKHLPHIEGLDLAEARSCTPGMTT